MTAKEMLPAIGQSVAVRFEEILVNCTVRNVKSSYGRTRLLVTPTQGMGEQWVELPRVSNCNCGPAPVHPPTCPQFKQLPPDPESHAPDCAQRFHRMAECTCHVAEVS